MVRRPMRSAIAVAVAPLVLSLIAVPPPARADDAIAVGDSITVGAQAQLRAAGFEVDAVVGRTFRQGLDAIRARSGSLPARVLVNLGTNGGVTTSQCSELTSLVGPDRSLTIVTINLPSYPGIAASSNAVLTQCAQRAGARLVDWAAYSRAHPGALCQDGIHITCGGAAEYSRFVLSQAAPAPDPATYEPPADGAAAGPRAASGGGSWDPAVAGTAPAADGTAAGGVAAQEAAAEAAAKAAEAAAQAAQAAQEAARKQARISRLQQTGVQDLARVELNTSAASYRFVPVAERLSRAPASS